MNPEEELFTLDQISEILDTTSYFAFHRHFTKVMSKIEAVFIQDILNRRNATKKNPYSQEHGPLMDEEGYFLCTTSFLQDPDIGMEWSDKEQRMHFSSLSNERGFLKTKSKPTKHGSGRWVKIYLGRILKAIRKVMEDEQLNRMDAYKSGEQLYTKNNGKKGGSSPIGRHPSSPIGLPNNEDTSYLLNQKNSRRKPSRSLRSPSGLPATSVENVLVVNSRQPFFHTKQDSATLPEHKEFAIMLRMALRSQGIPCGNKNPIRAWSDEFRKLNDVVDTPTIRLVLIWYCSNIGKERMYQAYSGKAFRLKFDKIWSWYRRDKEQNPDITLPDEATKLLKEVESWKWPKDSKKYLPATFALSWKAHEEMRKKVSNFLKDKPPEGECRDAFVNFVRRYAAPYLFSSNSFLVYWFKTVNKELTNWTDWNGSEGSFRKRGFSADNETFRKEIFKRSHSYGGKDIYAERFMELVKS